MRKTISLALLSSLTNKTTTLFPPLPSSFTHFSTSSQNPKSPNPNPRTRTPLEKQFDSWVAHLRPGFTPSDVIAALRSQSDPDLALDLFRWTAQQRGYRHDPSAYLAIIDIAASGKRFSAAESLIDEVLAGACSTSLPLYNFIIRFCCSRRHLLNRSFDVFKKMQRSPGWSPFQVFASSGKDEHFDCLMYVSG